jgi:hypothetical protein
VLESTSLSATAFWSGGPGGDATTASVGFVGFLLVAASSS